MVPNRKTLLDYFSQTSSPDRSAVRGSFSETDPLQSRREPTSPKRPRRLESKATEECSTDIIEQLSDSCIFSSCPDQSDSHYARGSSKMSAIVADFLDVEDCASEELCSAGPNEERYGFLLDVRDENMRRRGEEGYDPSTLHIPPECYRKFTSFERQFWDIKRKHYDTVIFFKKGKFYELYENDAEIASNVFDLRIVERVNMKMAGFPESSYDAWAAKFLSHGYKIGKVDQAENSIGKRIREQDGRKDKIISRELKEVVTQGTIYRELSSSLPVYLGVVVRNETCHADLCTGPLHFSVVLYDASTNTIFPRSFCDSHDMCELRSVFVQNDVREVIADVDISLPSTTVVIRPVKTVIASQRKYDFKNDREFLSFTYLHNYMRTLCRESCLASAVISDMHDAAGFMSLDGSTLVNMDILANNFDGTETNTLFKAITYTSTPFGQRLLRKWLVSPLTDIEKILERRSFAEIFRGESLVGLVARLEDLGDLERCLGKICSTNPTLRDMSMLVLGLRKSRSFLEFLSEFLGSERYDNAKEMLGVVAEVLNIFDGAYKITDVEIVPTSENDELCMLCRDRDLIHKRLDAFLCDLKKSTGIPDLCYKSVGKEIFQVEVPNGASLPSCFFAVSSTKTHKRFYSRELKSIVDNLAETEERIFQSRGSILQKAAELLRLHATSISHATGYLAAVDCFISFARFNRTNKAIIPVFSDRLEMTGLTSPVYPDYIRNDFRPSSRIALITGPNMGGKSTYLRSICLNIILAQMGMGVLCEYMSTPVFDKIFTRIGASDSLAKGESTFMIELSEASRILNQSTSRSLVIVDELGRGTSTRDGEAIARAVLDYIRKLECYTLFSTHYHRLVEEYKDADKLHVKCKVDSGDIVFLHKIEEGVCYDSHGLYVARLAGVPEEVVARSFEIRETLLKKGQAK